MHPIRKMQRASKKLWERDHGGPYRIREALTTEADCRLMARHVRPLLDALEEALKRTRVEHEFCDSSCPIPKAERLLAEWGAKLND